MPKGPRGEKRPADVIGNAVKVMRIATGEETEELETDRAKSAAAELGSRSGYLGWALLIRRPQRRALRFAWTSPWTSALCLVGCPDKASCRSRKTAARRKRRKSLIRSKVTGGHLRPDPRPGAPWRKPSINRPGLRIRSVPAGLGSFWANSKTG